MKHTPNHRQKISKGMRKHWDKIVSVEDRNEIMKKVRAGRWKGKSKKARRKHIMKMVEAKRLKRLSTLCRTT